MKRTILITTSVASVLVVTQLLAWAKPFEPGVLNEIGKIPLPLTQSSEPTRKPTEELTAAAIEHPEPAYPPLAKAARISGNVEVEVVIDQRGNVTDARAVSGHPLLKDAAVASARQWKFNF